VPSRKETGLDVDVDMSKYLVMSGDQNAGRSHSIKTDNSSFERVEEFGYLGTTIRTQKFIQEDLLRARCSQEILAIIRCRIFCFSVCYPKI